MSELALTPLPPRREGSVLHQSCLVRRLGSSAPRDTTLWWESPGSLPPLRDGDAEPYLIASLFPAMAEGRDLRIEGAIGRRLLANVDEFTTAWSRWKPSTYRKIRIDSDAILEDEPAPWSPDAVVAFSGGVDATYTVWRHHARLAGNGSRRITACALVHGFDISLEHEEKFAVSLELARDTLESVGIEFVPLRTNIRTDCVLDWHDTHGAALVATMHFLKSRARTLLVGSSDPYDQLIFPYGSNPVTDPLLSSGSLEVVHDGSGSDRTEKIAAIAAWEKGRENLRVCWKGVQPGANCGRCEKCLRTRLNFLVNGIAPPESLAPADSVPDFGLLDSEDPSILQEFEQILRAARRDGLSADWIDRLSVRIRWLHLRGALRRGARSSKRLLRRIAGRSR